MRIGILGGTFNPIHKGHMKLAKDALSELSLDMIWIMPAGDPPHKDEITTSTRVDRLELCRAAVSSVDESNILVSDYELFKATPAYTYETVSELKKAYPDNDFYFLIGEDSLEKFPTWVHPEIIIEYVTLVACAREKNSDHSALNKTADHIEKKFGKRPIILETEAFPISSTEIRNAVDAGRMEDVIRYLEPSVYEYIDYHRLYRKTYAVSLDRIEEIRSDLKKRLKKSRFYHTLGVADTCASLAQRYGYPVNTAYLAGLLHDCAKYMSGEEYIDYAKKHDLNITKSENAYPDLLHSKIGAYLAANRYDVHDHDIVHAIEVHTTGEPEMNLLDEILYVADYIEPMRTKQPRLSDVRAMAYYDLKACIRMILSDTIEYLRNRSKVFDPKTYETALYYGLEVEEPKL